MSDPSVSIDGELARFLAASEGPLILVVPEPGVSVEETVRNIKALRGVAAVADASDQSFWRGSWPMDKQAMARLESATLGAIMAGWRVMYHFVPLAFEGGHLRLFAHPVKSPSLQVYDSITALFREARENPRARPTPTEPAAD